MRRISSTALGTDSGCVRPPIPGGLGEQEQGAEVDAADGRGLPGEQQHRRGPGDQGGVQALGGLGGDEIGHHVRTRFPALAIHQIHHVGEQFVRRPHARRGIVEQSDGITPR
ncbi:hypothetical protein [Nocardia sp. N2S4-5]|uniref:hypothetical protein n=1 Tax=Nocardia sp. N2S4-5 TaxID=3351565 RepID=UPI0037D741B5